MVRVTPNTCKSLMLGFVYAPFSLNSIAINASITNTHKHTHTVTKCNQIHSNEWFDCVRFCVFVFKGIRGLHALCTIPAPIHWFELNHQLKARVHSHSCVFPMYVRTGKKSRAFHFPWLPVYANPYQTNYGNMYVYGRALASILGWTCIFLSHSRESEQEHFNTKQFQT